MAAGLVGWALVAALCPLFLSASPPPPWDFTAWKAFAVAATALWSFLAIPSR